MEYPPSTSFDPPLEPVMDPYCMRCQECGETKSTTRLLFDHLFEHHNYDKARIASLKQQRKARSTHIVSSSLEYSMNSSLYYCLKSQHYSHIMASTSHFVR